MSGIWREPAEETEDYPNLIVHDGRVTGSITAGRTRLPLWAFIGTVVERGWDDIEEDYPSASEIGARGMAGFLYNLLEARGEFGRLLLILADVERLERERDGREVDDHFRVAHPGGHVCECGFDGPGPWWMQDDLRGRMAGQLRNCLEVLEGQA